LIDLRRLLKRAEMERDILKGLAPRPSLVQSRSWSVRQPKRKHHCKPWWKLVLPPALRIWPVWGAVLLSLLAAVFIGPVQRTLHFELLGLRDWGIVLAASLASVGWRITGLSSGTTGRALLVSEAIKTP